MTIKRWPIIRHIRALYLGYRVEKHYEMWAKFGMLPVNKDRDYEHLRAIWRGEA